MLECYETDIGGGTYVNRNVTSDRKLRYDFTGQEVTLVDRTDYSETTPIAFLISLARLSCDYKTFLGCLLAFLTNR